MVKRIIYSVGAFMSVYVTLIWTFTLKAYIYGTAEILHEILFFGDIYTESSVMFLLASFYVTLGLLIFIVVSFLYFSPLYVSSIYLKKFKATLTNKKLIDRGEKWYQFRLNRTELKNSDKKSLRTGIIVFLLIPLIVFFNTYIAYNRSQRVEI